MSNSNTDIRKLDPLFPFHIRGISSGIISFDHPDLYQVILLKKGKILFHIHGNEHKISGKHAIFIPPAVSLPDINLPDCEIIQILFGNQFIESIIITGIDENVLRLFNLYGNEEKTDQSVIFIPLDEISFADISQITEHILDELNRKSGVYQSMIRIKFMELLLSLYRINPLVSENRSITRNSSGSNINKITEYIIERYSDSLTLDGIAVHFGMNPSYLSRIFREATGTALFEYINQIRIQKSCMLLKRSNMTIIEIAFSVGYNNISHFNRYFRRIMKMSPREYKNYIKK